MPVGIKAIDIFFMTSRLKNSFRYNVNTANMAPNWIIISKLFNELEFCIFNNELTNIKCPVDEIGKNSVIPSIIPKIIE